MKLTLHTFLSIDGVMQGPGGLDEDRSGGFDRGGWLIPYGDEVMGEIAEGWFARADAILLGRTTYTMMQAYWSQIDDGSNTASGLNNLPKYVATSTPLEPVWNDSTALTGDVLKQVEELKAKPGGELQVHGSAGLARSLHRAGLIDEYRLLTFPVAIGAGKRLFTEDAPAMGFELVESRVTSTGATYAALRPTPFRTGTAVIEDGTSTFSVD
ncbi:dihydrofolate reductase family protein [Kribbella sp. CA-293567]|uniref:dihydrofolate reductase family protein n=1 Tax=Kribbella sp. CA-293567 TaxID=3002436 RepID=UPI0022DD6250|nr:dihydrofolate reductase family protein [Kribbella sp. CA-293567]WBQ05553.1 dihydrofolate reductase family protein [Kribbella sp. CA-293567]